MIWEWYERMLFYRERPHGLRVDVKAIRPDDFIFWKRGWHRVVENIHDISIRTEDGTFHLEGESPRDTDFRHLTPSQRKKESAHLILTALAVVIATISLVRGCRSQAEPIPRQGAAAFDPDKFLRETAPVPEFDPSKPYEVIPPPP